MSFTREELDQIKQQAAEKPYEVRLKLRQSGINYTGPCPWHDDATPSFSVFRDHDTQAYLWKCHACQTGGDVIKFVQEFDKIDFKEAAQRITNECGISTSVPRSGSTTTSAPLNGSTTTTAPRGKPEAIYEYTSAEGTLRYQVLRNPGKGFCFRRPDGKHNWIYNLQGVERLIYRLPEVLTAERVLIPEGEKDCETLRTLGLTATTNSGGAGKWLPEFGDYFQGKDVVVLPDNDGPGREHAEDVARSLLGKARSIKVVELPGLPDKGDVSDFIGTYGQEIGKKLLVAAITDAPLWEPPQSGVVALRGLLEKCETDVAVGQIIKSIQGQLRRESQSDEYPKSLGADALQGLVGEFVNAALPFTEADANCLAYQFLTAAGNAIGRDVFAHFGADRHYPNLFLLTVGSTGTGKGQGLGHVQALMRIADTSWQRERCKYSAASGEAIVRLCAEATGQTVDGQCDLGLSSPEVLHNGDGRLLLVLTEISILWNSMNREGANTSGYLRSAYDGAPLENNRARSKVMASDYLLSLISHCTPEELAGLVDKTAWYNGLVNRFLFAAVSKSKTLPRMNRTPDYMALANRLSRLLALQYTGAVDFSAEGGKAWDDWVNSLPELDGLMGAAMQRIRPNALRVALIYAALDEERLQHPNTSFHIEVRHVRAAIEIVERSIASVRWFLSQPMKVSLPQDYDKVRRIKEAANKSGGQLTGTELRSLLSHDSAEDRQRLATEAGLRLVVAETGEQGGRKGQLWKN